jgi:hypothetical protein
MTDRHVCVTEEYNGFAITVTFEDCHCGCGRQLPFSVMHTIRAKSGTDIEEVHYELSVRASSIMQHKS